MLPALALSLLALSPAFADAPAAQSAVREDVNPNTSAMSGHGFSVGADFLFWKTREDGLVYGVQNTATPATGTLAVPATPTHVITKGHALNVAQRWTPGFRVQAGFDPQGDKMDGWDFNAAWTHMSVKPKKNNSAVLATATGTAGGPYIMPSLQNPAYMGSNAEAPPVFAGIPTGSLDFAYSAQAAWNLKLNLVDLELGKEFYAGNSKTFSLRPHFGVRYASVKQDLATTYLSWTTPASVPTAPTAASTITSVITNDQKATGFGVRGGIDAEYGIPMGSDSCVSIYGKLAASLLMTKFDVSNSSGLSAVGAFGATSPAVGHYKGDVDNNSDHATKAVADLDLGVQWEKGFSGNKYWLTVAAGWEQHIFFNHNRMIRFVDNAATGNFINNGGDLAFSGFKLSGKFDF